MMNLIVEHVDVWEAVIDDMPGGLANILTSLREVGVDLDFIIARRAPEKPGTGVVFVTPLRGELEIAAASHLGFNVTDTLHSLRVQGEFCSGITANLTTKLAEAGINLQGLSAAVIGKKIILYIGFDNGEDAANAACLLKNA